jgi:hypothetical protein
LEHRAERIKRGENVEGGLGKPMSSQDYVPSRDHGIGRPRRGFVINVTFVVDGLKQLELLSEKAPKLLSVIGFRG